MLKLKRNFEKLDFVKYFRKLDIPVDSLLQEKVQEIISSMTFEDRGNTAAVVIFVATTVAVPVLTVTLLSIMKQHKSNLVQSPIVSDLERIDCSEVTFMKAK